MEQINLRVVDTYVEIVLNKIRSTNPNEYFIINDSLAIESVTDMLTLEEITYSMTSEKTPLETIESSLTSLVNYVNQKFEGSDQLVVTVADDSYPYLALYHCLLTQSQILILDRLEEVATLDVKSDYKYLTLVSPRNIPSKLYHLGSIRNQELHFQYGVLTAGSESLINSFLIKNNICKMFTEITKTICLDRIDEQLGNQVLEAGNRITIPVNATDMATIEKFLVEDATDLLGIISHGREDVIWLNDGAICGKSKRVQQMNLTDRVPTCIHTGKCLNGKDAVINAYALQAKHIFAYSCHGLKTEKCIFQDGFDLASAVLEGSAVSVIGSNTEIYGNNKLVYYYLSLLQAGFTLGDTLQILNRCWNETGYGYPNTFYLIGDPLLKYVDTGQFTLEIEAEQFDKLETSGLELDAEYNLVSIKLPEGYDSYFYICKDGDKQLLFNQVRAEGTDHYLDIFGLANLSGRISIRKQAKIFFDLDIIDEFDQYYYLGVTDKKYDNLISYAKQYGKHILSYRMHDSQQKHLIKKYGKLKDNLKTLSEKLVEYYLIQTNNKNLTIEEMMIDHGFRYHHSEEVTDLCLNCESPLTNEVYYNVFRKDIKRSELICPACGSVKNQPEELGDIEIMISKNNQVNLGEEFTLTVTIENKSGQMLSGNAGVAILGGKFIDLEYLMNSTSVEINPKQREMYQFRLQIQELTPPHYYWLAMYLILNGKLYVFRKSLWVKPNTIELR